MKKLHKVFILVLLAGPIFFIGCQKTDLLDESVQTLTNEFIENKDYCGNTMTFTLGNAMYDYGYVTVGNDESNLILNFELNDVTDYIQDVRIFVINEGLTPPLGHYSGGYVADVWNANLAGGGTGHFWSFNFPFITTVPNTTAWQEVITFQELEDEGITLDECISIVAIAYLYDQSMNYSQFASAKPSLKTDAWFVDFCIEPCEEPSCETAYAYGGDQDDCFLNLNTQGNNWGWSNGGIPEGTYAWDIYAGAGQCDLSKGTLVGTLDIVYSYSTGVATIFYNIDAAYTLEETHLHIGETEATRLPLNKKNKFITAPGKFEYSGGNSFVIEDLTGPIWVTAHAVVCGDFE